MTGNIFFAELIAKRRQLVEALEANKDEVNLDIFEDFYPDRAHFVFELLQNAEDARATEVTFALYPDRLVCEHDGARAFTEQDVSSITGIHNSKKGVAPDQIGKFGVGFKSVFVYTQSPTIRSGAFSFRVVKLILPEPIEHDPSIGSRTRFTFPFDNPSKPPEEAFADISAGLHDLDETTLLFLTNLRTIKWRIGDESGHVERRALGAGHIEIERSDGRVTSVSHFLKFDSPIEGMETHRAAIAFPLEFLQGVRTFDSEKPLARQLRIVPAAQGRVAVFFTAAKETSGLLFHLHAPFIPELSRASIKEAPANEPLFEQLARLSASALHKIKDLGLLNAEFLAILPNPKDQIPPRYQPIRNAVIEEMRARPLTPTNDRGHAAAAHLIQARASLKNLLSNEDLEYLVDYEENPPLWAIGATQRSSRIDDFLNGLGIKEWGLDAFVDLLAKLANPGSRYIARAPYWVQGPDEAFMRWLAQKPPEWLQQLYSLLGEEALPSKLHRLRTLKIVRLRDGSFEVPSNCFFAKDEDTKLAEMVDARVFTSGRSKPAQERAKKFLADFGVRELGEAEEIELALRARYTQEAKIPDVRTYMRDLKRFVALVEEHPAKARMFDGYYVFQGEGGDWHTPSTIYLDLPYQQTELLAYFSRLATEADHHALHPRYKTSGIALKRIAAFAKALGARTELPIVEGRCRDNPQWDHLRGVRGERFSSPIDRDYFIPKLTELLATPSVDLSRSVWRALISIPADADYWQATYQRSNSWGSRSADSRLVHELRNARWVPQRNGEFVRPAEAVRQLLPEGFPFDAGNAGLKAVHFGSGGLRQVAQQEQKDSLAQKAGFANAEAMERAKRFAELPPEEQEKFFADRERASRSAVPDRAPINLERRAQSVADQAADAPDKESEIRPRSVSIGREDVKVLAEEYLRLHYRNADGDMTCQICQGPLPFKLDDGTEFFETVELLPELTKRHFQNYLALCPNHSAMYRHANASKQFICEMIESLDGDKLEITLAQRDVTLYLSAIHLIDIKAVIAAERSLPPGSEGEAA